jgi:hypothetical protein
VERAILLAHNMQLGIQLTSLLVFQPFIAELLHEFRELHRLQTFTVPIIPVNDPMVMEAEVEKTTNLFFFLDPFVCKIVLACVFKTASNFGCDISSSESGRNLGCHFQRHNRIVLCTRCGVIDGDMN